MIDFTINNKNAFLLPEVPTLFPGSIKYTEFWKTEMKKIIEGMWAQDTLEKDASGLWRFMPPQLYFYPNYFTIEHRPEDAPISSPKQRIKPYLRDVEWEVFYDIFEVMGFSGFEDDENYTSCALLRMPEIPTRFYPRSVFKPGTDKLKEYVPPETYLRALHDQPLGAPLYDSPSKNMMMLSTREIGKSYIIGCVILHTLVTQGRKRYVPGQKPLPRVRIFVGSGNSAKSAELLDKVQQGMENLPGVWAAGTDEEEPSPLYMRMTGSLAPNKRWVHRYRKKEAGEWKYSGTNSTIYHGVFTANNPEAAAGGRYNLIVVEEVGLTGNVLQIHHSNEAAQRQGIFQYGPSLYIGTGGNMEKVVESEIMFTDPTSYNCLAREDIYEGTGKIGIFLPAMYKDNEYKDANGNTDYQAAEQYYLAREEEKRKAKSSVAVNMERMNYPRKPSDMFINKTSNRFNVVELKRIYARLVGNTKLIDTSYKGYYDMTSDGKPVWVNDKEARPIREFPFKGNDDMEGACEMFEPPIKDVNGVTPAGMYIACIDPVDDDDNEDSSLSLQSFHILNLLTDRIVFEYTGRTKFAKEFYEQARRALIAYNAKMMYENQKKGIYGYFENKHSLYLLATTPKILVDKDMLSELKSVGNKAYGIHVSDAIINWGLELFNEYLEEQAFGYDEGVTKAMLLRSPALLKETIMHGAVKNTDRVSAMIMLMIYREQLVKYVEQKRKSGPPPKTHADSNFMKLNKPKKYGWVKK